MSFPAAPITRAADRLQMQPWGASSKAARLGQRIETVIVSGALMPLGLAGIALARLFFGWKHLECRKAVETRRR
jgi:hypothetical protein